MKVALSRSLTGDIHSILTSAARRVSRMTKIRYGPLLFHSLNDFTYIRQLLPAPAHLPVPRTLLQEKPTIPVNDGPAPFKHRYRKCSGV
jgi:hypothetical protein